MSYRRSMFGISQLKIVVIKCFLLNRQRLLIANREESPINFQEYVDICILLVFNNSQHITCYKKLF